MATPVICSIPDCGKKTYARGWCALHYCRWQKHRDPLYAVNPSPGSDAPVKEALERAAKDDMRSVSSMAEKILRLYLEEKGYLKDA